MARPTPYSSIRRRDFLAAAATGAAAIAPVTGAAAASATNPADLGLLEAAELLHARKLSAKELTTACLARIDARNGGRPTFDGAPRAVNAWARLCPGVALRQARAADRRLARRERGRAPVLCGIAIGLKDLYAVKGLRLTASSHVLTGHVASRDSAVWKRLHGAGMVLLGHTHTHEFGAGATTDQVGNPWRLDRSAGGSSGGSAAALAARMVPAATGTDTGGSVRLPAALCGVSAIKPTRGLVPMDGVIPVAASFDHGGPMARTVADCAALLQTMARGRGLPRLATRPRHGSRPLAGLRVALTSRLPEDALDADVADGLERARRALERLGARVAQRRAPATAAVADADYGQTFEADLWAYHRRFADRSALYRPAVAELVAAAAASHAELDYDLARRARRRVTAAWSRWFAHQRVDLILEPTVPMPAPLRGDGYEHANPAAAAVLAFTALWNATGFPVVSFPAGLGRRTGLPVGVSLVAPPRADAVAIRAAVDLQARGLRVPRVT